MLAADGSVRARALGSVHNLSVDVPSILMLLEIKESVPTLVSLLRDSVPEICQVACGTLQNLSRDPEGRRMIAQGTAAVEHLADLLCSTSLGCQVAAVGALLNIMGPSSSSSSSSSSSMGDEQDAEKKALRTLLTDGIVLGAIRACVFEDEDVS